MDTDFIFKQVQHMRPPSFSEREQQRYQAEKMLMRQFMLMKEQHQVPIHLSTKNMKEWLLAGRSFLEEFQEIAKKAEARKLFVAELAWMSARCLCLNQMEEELREDIVKEKRLSLQFSRKVTVEGLQMFLSVIRPKAEQGTRIFLYNLSDKLLSLFTGSHMSKRSELALLTKLQRTTIPLVRQIVDIALKFLLDEPEPLVEVKPSQNQGSVKSSDLTSALRNRTKAASFETGKLLADTVATSFCLNTSATKARLMCICTSLAQDMVKAIYKRFVDRSETFHLMNFDESFITAREGVICAVQDMDARVQNSTYRWTQHEFFTEKDLMTPEMCCVVATKKTGEKDNKYEKGGEKDEACVDYRMNRTSCSLYSGTSIR